MQTYNGPGTLGLQLDGGGSGVAEQIAAWTETVSNRLGSCVR
jgi:hypothetical protein